MVSRLRRVGAPGHDRPQRGGVEPDLPVEARALVGDQRPPVVQRPLPVLALRAVLAALEERERGVVRRDHPGPGPGLDRHVADGHPPGHVERADRLAPVLDHVAGPAVGAELGDDPEHQVLGGDPVRQFAVHGDRHRGRLGLPQRLGGEHVLDFGRPDAERERPERSVSRGVAVAADHGHARLSQPELRADHVHHALLGAAERIERDPVRLAVLAQPRHLLGRQRIGDRPVRVYRRHIVVHRGHRQVRPADRASGQLKTLKRLRMR